MGKKNTHSSKRRCENVPTFNQASVDFIPDLMLYSDGNNLTYTLA